MPKYQASPHKSQNRPVKINSTDMHSLVQAVMTMADTGDQLRVLLYSYHATITGWGGGTPNIYTHQHSLRNRLFTHKKSTA